MADNKSSEDVKVIKETFEQLYGNNEVKAGVDYGTKKNDMSIKITADVSNALKGLKAVQREARKTTAALKEFEQAHNKVKEVAYKCGVSGKELVSLLVNSRGDSNE